MVALCPGEEGCLHDRLGVVGRDLPQAVVRLQATLGQLQVKVAPAGVHLQHLDLFEDGTWIFDSNLDRRLVRVVDLDHRGVARVQRQLHTDQRLKKEILMIALNNPLWICHLYSVRIRSASALNGISKASSAGVDVKGKR